MTVLFICDFSLWRSVVSSPVFWGWARLRLIEYMDNFREVMQSKIIRSIPEIAVYFFEQVHTNIIDEKVWKTERDRHHYLS